MALVTKTHPGNNGKVRKLELKVTNGGTVRTLLRPVTEVVVLVFLSFYCGQFPALFPMFVYLFV